MIDRGAEEALALFVGSHARARAILGTTTLRHLAEAPPEELAAWLPEDLALRFRAALRLARLALSPERSEALEGPWSAFAHFHPYLAGFETERVVIAALDGRFRPLATELVAQGSPVRADVRPADAFAAAVRHRAMGIVVAHNHPSGEATPSLEDYELTRRLSDAGEILGIRLVDHLVVTGAGLWSLLAEDRGMSAEEARRSSVRY